MISMHSIALTEFTGDSDTLVSDVRGGLSAFGTGFVFEYCPIALNTAHGVRLILQKRCRGLSPEQPNRTIINGAEVVCRRIIVTNP